MSRYLEFDSTYRNRVLYPLPSDFTIEMAQSGQGSKLTAQDPVSEASPILYWNNNFINGTTGQTYIDGLQVSPAPSPSSQGASIFQIQGTDLKQVKNFYVGSVLARDATGNSPSGTITPPVITRRIVEYNPLNTSNAMITLESPLPDSVVGMTGFYISNPTPIATDTTSSTIKFYIPGSNQCLDPSYRTQTYGLGSDNYYINFYVMNTDTGTYRTITSFDAITRLATLDSSTPALEDWSNVSQALSNFVIRKSIPLEGSWGAGTPIIFATTKAVQLPVVSPVVETDTYTGDFIRIAPSIGAVPPYNVTTTPPYNAAVTAAFPTNCQTEERRISRYVYGAGTIQAIAGTTISLGSTASDVVDDYVGALISNTSIVNPLPAYVNPTVTIVSYDSVTKQAVTDAPLGGAPGDTWLIRTCLLSSPFSTAPNPENLYEIEPFTRDNYNPFVYTGSLVSSQEVVCYEVELLNLILPNAILASGRGGRPIFYPYLYVELEQITSRATSKNIIYSNNPHSSRMLFRAVVDDTPIPAISPFIKIDGDGMVHTIKFKPNDAFRFAVYHANGEAFRTILDEQFSPSAPNALTQISACFSFKRV